MHQQEHAQAGPGHRLEPGNSPPALPVTAPQQNETAAHLERDTAQKQHLHHGLAVHHAQGVQYGLVRRCARQPGEMPGQMHDHEQRHHQPGGAVQDAQGKARVCDPAGGRRERSAQGSR